MERIPLSRNRILSLRDYCVAKFSLLSHTLSLSLLRISFFPLGYFFRAIPFNKFKTRDLFRRRMNSFLSIRRFLSIGLNSFERRLAKGELASADGPKLGLRDGTKRREKCIFADAVIHFEPHYLHTSLPSLVF